MNDSRRKELKKVVTILGFANQRLEKAYDTAAQDPEVLAKFPNFLEKYCDWSAHLEIQQDDLMEIINKEV